MDDSTAETTTRLRIALVITELDVGGAERCLTELALFLSKQGHHVRVLALGEPPAPLVDGLWRQLQQAQIDVRFIHGKGLRHAVRSIGRLRRELAEFEPHVVQAMLWHANVATAVALRGHSCVFVGGMRVSEPRWWRWPIERWAARRMASLVCVSDDVRRHAERAERIEAAKLCVIPNGISGPPLPAEYDQSDRPSSQTGPGVWSPLGFEPREHQMLYVGRLEPQKGVLELAEHLPQLLAPLADWSCIVMGRGSLREAMERAVKQRGCGQQVHFTAWQPEAARWMPAADVILLPANYEGMPNVLLEAMHAGKPFVAFAVDGISQLLSGDYPAELREVQLIPPQDWPKFVKAVHTLANNPQLRQRCGQANQRHVLAHFRLEDQLARYEALYCRLVATTANQPILK